MRGYQKYRNKEQIEPCKYGFSHRSKLELAVCNQLWWLEKGGTIKVEAHEDRITFPCAECGEKVIYIADFRVRDLAVGYSYWVEAKGLETDKWPKVKRAWRRAGPGPLEIYKGKWQSPMLVETITPNFKEQEEQ